MFHWNLVLQQKWENWGPIWTAKGAIWTTLFINETIETLFSKRQGLFFIHPTSSWATLLEWLIWRSLQCTSILYFCMYSMQVHMEAGEPGILITHGFSNRWYFTGSISSPGSGFIGLIGASSGKSAGGFCGERSCLTRGKVEGGPMKEKNGGGCGGQYLSLHHSQSVSHSLWLDLFVFC